jgi:hypothetical protein
LGSQGKKSKQFDNLKMIEMCQTPLFGFHFSGARYAKNICTFRKSQVAGKEKPRLEWPGFFLLTQVKIGGSSPI